jgi:hypothetical protein
MVVADHRCSSSADGIVEFSRARRLRHGRRSGGLAGEEASDITDRAHQRGREHHRGVLVHPPTKVCRLRRLHVQQTSSADVDGAICAQPRVTVSPRWTLPARRTSAYTPT